MAAVTSYSTLTASLATWADRTYSADQTDEFIGLAESKFNRKVGSNYRRKSTAVIAIDSAGLGTLPTGSVAIISIVRDLLGSLPLKQVSWDALIQRNPYQYGNDAEVYAVRGTAIQTEPRVADNFNVVYWATLTGLTSVNATNWLMDLAPDIYLSMCMSVQRGYEEEWNAAAIFEGQAMDGLTDLLGQATIAEYGDAEVTLPMATP